VAFGREVWRAFVRFERLLAWPLILLVRAYKLFISPALPPSCKYHPSCSAYADEALCRHGLVRGSLLMTWRLCRCNPLSHGGYDPVPGTHAREVRPARRVCLETLRVRRPVATDPALLPLEESS
jgi:putative membrane protein insertion efficiency factor